MCCEPNTLDRPETVVFNGILYRLMGTKRYYLSQSTSNAGRKGAKGLHVAIYEFHTDQTVPKGHVVHHKDGNPFNNSIDNLECMEKREHCKLYKSKDPEKQAKHLAEIRPKAAEWHKSEEGHAWHKEHAKSTLNHEKRFERTCLVCGKEFKSSVSTAKYCSKKCARSARWKREKANGYNEKRREKRKLRQTTSI